MLWKDDVEPKLKCVRAKFAYLFRHAVLHLEKAVDYQCKYPNIPLKNLNFLPLYLYIELKNLDCSLKNRV